MTTILLATVHSIAETQSDRESFKSVLLFCCCGLAASIGLLTLGIDLSAAWL
jgi:hypothetical protein